MITISPLSYRQVLMLNLHRLRPNLEVVLAEPEELDQKLERLGPELVICSAATPLLRDSDISWVEVLLFDGLGANVCVGGVLSKLEDAGIDDVRKWWTRRRSSPREGSAWSQASLIMSGREIQPLARASLEASAREETSVFS